MQQPERLNERLQKLRQMAELGTGAEAEAAQRILDNLIEKYTVDSAETEPVQHFTVQYNPRLRETALHLAASLGIERYRYNGERRNIHFNCTQSEYNVYVAAYNQLDKLFKAKQSEMYKEINGFMYGFMELTYPIQSEEPQCPQCAEVLEYDVIDRRYYCVCGYKGKKLRARYINQKGAEAGAEASGRLLNQ